MANSRCRRRGSGRKRALHEQQPIAQSVGHVNGEEALGCAKLLRNEALPVAANHRQSLKIEPKIGALLRQLALKRSHIKLAEL